MRMQNKIKVKFYILTVIGFVLIISVLILGSLLGIYDKYFNEVPRYKSYIFYGSIMLCGLYCIYYVNYMFKHDEELSEKDKKKV